MQNENLLNENHDEKPARKRLPIASKDDALKAHISVGSAYDNLTPLSLCNCGAILDENLSLVKSYAQYLCGNTTISIEIMLDTISTLTFLTLTRSGLSPNQ